jgi:uncharacterized membrane protein YeaQ/YmgE (transglycosylase-associated protein family)
MRKKQILRMIIILKELELKMGILSWIVVGLLAGWLAGLVVKGGGFGCVGDIVVGVIGALLGGWIASYDFRYHFAPGNRKKGLTLRLGRSISTGGTRRRAPPILAPLFLDSVSESTLVPPCDHVGPPGLPSAQGMELHVR